MVLFLALILLPLAPPAAEASYDESWYLADGWSGAYAEGVAVLRPGVRMPARRQAEREGPRDLECELPDRANFHPLNKARVATYLTATKVQKLRARAHVTLNGGPAAVRVKPAEVIEYLGFIDENTLRVRREGLLYRIDSSLLADFSYDEKSLQEAPDEWVRVPCGASFGWLLFSELTPRTKEGRRELPPGLGEPERGFHDESGYGDLTDQDLLKRRRGREATED